MAKNMWGKQPPKKKPYTPPALGTPNFWGPAPVPPKVYQVWDDIRGDGRDGADTDDQDGVDGGAHDSWVSRFSKRFATDPVNIAGEGRDGNSTATSGGDDGNGGSFATGDGDAETGASSVAGEGRDGDSTDTEGRNSTSNPVNIAGDGRDGTDSDGQDGLTFGFHDSWVSGFEKELASSTSGSADPTVREQGTGEHDSWVSKFSKQIATDPFSVSGDGADGSFVAKPVKKPPVQPPATLFGQGRPDSASSAPSGLTGTPSHDSWVNAFKKQLVKGEGKSWTGAVGTNAPVAPSSFTSGPAVQQAKPPSDKFVGQWNFRVKINGIPDDNCKLLSISGLSSETEPIEFKRSTRQYVESIPGKYKYSNIELTKVMNMGGDSFARWREQIEAGANAFRTITVYLHHIDLKGDPVMTLTLHDAWPVKWEFPELSGSSSDAAIEKITLDVARITRG